MYLTIWWNFEKLLFVSDGRNANDRVLSFFRQTFLELLILILLPQFIPQPSLSLHILVSYIRKCIHHNWFSPFKSSPTDWVSPCLPPRECGGGDDCKHLLLQHISEILHILITELWMTPRISRCIMELYTGFESDSEMWWCLLMMQMIPNIGRSFGNCYSNETLVLSRMKLMERSNAIIPYNNSYSQSKNGAIDKGIYHYSVSG